LDIAFLIKYFKTNIYNELILILIMDFKKKYSLGVAYLYNDLDIPNSPIIYSSERNFLFKRVTYIFRDDGFVVSGDSRKGTSFYYSWNLFDSYSRNSNDFFTFLKLPLLKNFIGFRFKKLNEILGSGYSPASPKVLWVLFSMKNIHEGNLITLINSKLKNNTKLTNKTNFNHIFYILLFFISIYFIKDETGFILLWIPLSLFMIFNFNNSYKII
jgi:hypothetical protein